jgi:hypothetical protein
MTDEIRRGMKAKTIKAVLRRKLDALLESIDDEAVRELVAKNTIVTGGAIASMLLGEPVNDFDIYFRDIDTCEAVAAYYVAQFKLSPPKNFKHGGDIQIWHERYDAGEESRVRIVVKSAGMASETQSNDYEYFEGISDDSGAAAKYVDTAFGVEVTENGERPIVPVVPVVRSFRPVFLSSNAITLSDKVQIILRFHGEPEQIHQFYDFVHCTNYWSSWDSNLVLRPEAMESLLSRELRYVGSKYPLCSLFRIRKFVQRGWTINAGQMLKMAFQMQSFDLTKFDVLEDQLTGVDVAYFNQVIERLREKGGETVDAAYLIEIINRMF